MVQVAERYRLSMLREVDRREAQRGKFVPFVRYVNTRYQFYQHHKIIASALESFLKRKEGKKKLMLCVPPQHGKSELASRLLPAFALGLNPDLKIAGCSYSADLAKSFNRDVQRTIDGPHYAKVFPITRLNSKRVATDTTTYLRNTHEFEIVGRWGSYKAIGVGGGITGRAVDLAIIDDPIKNAKQAVSATVRETIWQWYLNDVSTRLHNDSKVILIMTRWHEDDLAGRLLMQEPDEWEVITLQAIKEAGEGHPDDTREPGEALWPDRHSLEKLLKLRKLSERVFQSLYQQRPAPNDGTLIKRAWFKTYNPAELDWSRATIHFYLDTAYTEKQENDATAILAFAKIGGKLYLTGCEAVRKELPDLLEWIPEWIKANGGTAKSAVIVEPKASGLSVIQSLRKSEKTKHLNVIADKPPVDSKITRVNGISYILEAGKVFVPMRAPWVPAFLHECVMFPNGRNDDRVDCLVGAVNKMIVNQSGSRRMEMGNA